MQKTEPKVWTTISFVVIFVVCMGLALLRWMHGFNDDIMVINDAINSHITNFTLSVMLCILIGYMQLIDGKSYQSNVITGMLILVANFIYELFLPILNTVDIIDAVYGFVGVCFSLLYLLIISKYGFDVKS